MSKHDREIDKAITYGRFSPIKKGHICGIKDMLKICTHLTVGIIDSETPIITVDSSLEKFCLMADEKNSSQHTIFSLDERMSMVRAALSNFIAEGLVNVVSVQRPEYAVEQFDKYFPQNKYTVMFSGVDDNLFDKERNLVTKKILGNREVLLIQPSDDVKHNTDILKEIKLGTMRWSDVIPNLAYSLFQQYSADKKYQDLSR